MDYKGNIWKDESLKKESDYKAENEIIAMQKASAAIPDGCRATYEEIDEEEYNKKNQIKTEVETINEENIKAF